MASTRIKLIVALVIVVGIIGVLIETAVTKSSTYYVTVSELIQEGHGAINQQSTVSGNIVGSSVNWDPNHEDLQFSMNDANGGRAIPVVFHGAKPDDFANNWPVIVTGHMDASGKFLATKLLIKCPSKYKAQQQTYVATGQKT